MSADAPARRWKPYRAYKDSGVEWLEEVPEDWEVKRTDAVLEYKKEQANPNSIKGITVFHYSIPVIQETGDGAYEEGSEIDSSKLLLKGEELLVSKLNPRKGCVLISESHEVPTVCSSELIPMKAKICDLRYAFYLYSSHVIRERISSVVQSATRSHQRANPSDITKIWSAFPPLHEQRAIASFLDRQTAHLDVLISKKERLIALLEEKRTALISSAVTKGLDPNAPMKDSGIEWLKEIPIGWNVNRIKFTSYVKGRVGWHGLRSDEFTDVGPFLVTGTDFSNGKINWETCHHFSEERYNEDPYIQLKENDLLITKDGTIGKVAIVERLSGKASLNSGIMLIRPLKKHYMKEFMFWVLNSNLFSEYNEYTKAGSTIQHLYQETFEDFSFPVPSPPEQRAIASFLDRETSKLDALISKVREGIEKLCEYRTALISAAVTGKIDVREAVK